MKNYLRHFSLTLLACAALSACSEKVVTPAAPAAPAAPATVPAPPAPPVAAAPSAPAAPAEPVEPAEAPPVPQAKEMALVCEDRKIEVKASCLDLFGPRSLSCTSQSLTVSAVPGDKLNERIFKTEKGEGDVPDLVDEKIGSVACVRSKAGEKYIVTDMYNGGNCEECEWSEVYDWQGKQIGSTRDRKNKDAIVTEVIGYAAAKTAPGNVFGKDEMEKFYQGAITEAD